MKKYLIYIDYANQMKENLRERRVRVSVDFTDKSVEEKLKKAKLFKIPYIVLIGKKEYNNNEILVIRYGKEEPKKYTMEEVIEKFERRK